MKKLAKWLNSKTSNPYRAWIDIHALLWLGVWAISFVSIIVFGLLK